MANILNYINAETLSNPAGLLGRLIKEGANKLITGNPEFSTEQLEQLMTAGPIQQSMQQSVQANPVIQQAQTLQGLVDAARQNIVEPVMKSAMGGQDVATQIRAKAAEKALKKQADMQAQEALMDPQGEQALSQFISQAQPTQSQINNATVNQMNRPGAMTTIKPGASGAETGVTEPAAQPTQQPDPYQQQVQNIMNTGADNILQALLQGMGQKFEAGQAAIQGQRLQNLMSQQEILGEKPLQKGEREKQLMELDKELQKLATTAPDALNIEQASKFAIITSGQKGLQQAASLLDQNPNLLKTGNLPGFLKSQAGRQFVTAMESAYEGQLRAVSGATLGEEEIKRKVKQFGATILDSPETIRQKFSALNGFYNTAIRTADPTGIHRQRASNQTLPGTLEIISIKQAK